jgi:cell division protein FtsA
MQGPRRVLGLDVGDGALKAVVVEHGEDGASVVAVDEEPSRGLRAHVVVDMELVTRAMARLVARVLESLGADVDEVVCGVSGRHAQMESTVGVAGVRSGMVDAGDLHRVHTSAREGLVPSGRAELHLLVHHYRLGPGAEVKSALGLHGRRLEAWGQLVSADRATLRNLERCARQAGFSINRFAQGSLAAAEACLSPEEREGSVCLLDIGASSTEVVSFVEGTPMHTAMVALGGDHLTQGIVDTLRTPLAAAERLKRQHGAAHMDLATDARLEVPCFGDGPARAVERRVLCELLTASVEELLGLVARELDRAGAPTRPPFGFVLTGGGSLLPGLELTAEELLGASVHRLPASIPGVVHPVARDPRYSVALGLALMQPGGLAKGAGNLGGRLRDWFEQSF